MAFYIFSFRRRKSNTTRQSEPINHQSMQKEEKASFAERVVSMSQNLFDSLPSKGKPNEKEWTVLSTIFTIKLHEKEEWKPDQIVALGTGNRCLNKDQLNEIGDLINDSHAEIIARRSFLRWVYHQILSNDEESSQFFEKNEEGKWKIKPGIRFGMYSSHSPCGDANVFEGGDCEEMNGEPEPKRRKKEGTEETRAKQEKVLDYDLPENRNKPGLVRRKPGRGEPTLSVSCSDKIAMWNALGIQGALLSIFIEPIFISYFVIGEYFNYEALNRSLLERIENIPLKHPFGKKQVEIVQTLSSFSKGKKEMSKIGKPVSSGAAIGWNNSKFHEVTGSATGRKFGLTSKNFGLLKHSPLLSKVRFLSLALECLECLDNKSKEELEGKEAKMTYCQVKEMSKDYRSAKCTLLSTPPFDQWTRLDGIQYSSFLPSNFSEKQ